MTKIVDAARHAVGGIHVALEDGSIMAEVPDSSPDQQHLPVVLRKSTRWEKIDPPAGVKPKNVIPGPNGALSVVGADGRLYERQRDPTALYHAEYFWREIQLPDTP